MVRNGHRRSKHLRAPCQTRVTGMMRTYTKKVVARGGIEPPARGFSVPGWIPQGLQNQPASGAPRSPGPWRPPEAYNRAHKFGACYCFWENSMTSGQSRLRVAARSTFLVAVLCFSFAAVSAETIGIPQVVPIADNVDMTLAVRNECQLGEKVSSFLTEFAPNVRVADDTKQGRYLRMAITEVTAFGGGAWSGPKWMTVTGTLVENDKPIASFRAKRYSTGGAFGGFKGTCSIIGRCTKAIAQDIAEWLKNPVDGARLGDAQ